jgi:hypothetical protein
LGAWSVAIQSEFRNVGRKFDLPVLHVSEVARVARRPGKGLLFVPWKPPVYPPIIVVVNGLSKIMELS